MERISGGKITPRHILRDLWCGCSVSPHFSDLAWPLEKHLSFPSTWNHSFLTQLKLVSVGSFSSLEVPKSNVSSVLDSFHDSQWWWWDVS